MTFSFTSIKPYLRLLFILFTPWSLFWALPNQSRANDGSTFDVPRVCKQSSAENYTSVILHGNPDSFYDIPYSHSIAPSCPLADRVCAKEIHEIQNIMDVRMAGAYLSLVNLWRIAVNDDRFSQGAAIVANKILTEVVEDHLNKISRTNGVVKGNLYVETLAAYRSVGFNETESQQHTIELLALYASRGASMGEVWELSTQATIPLFASLGVISSGIAYLDAISGDNNFYGLPNWVKTNCEYSRKYHFWMSAYLTNELLKQGFSRKSAFDAVHKTAIAYELGKNFSEGIKDNNIHNWYIIETQKNIMFSDGGSAWVIRLLENNGQPLYIDSALNAAMVEARPKSDYSFVGQLAKVPAWLIDLVSIPKAC